MKKMNRESISAGSALRHRSGTTDVSRVNGRDRRRRHSRAAAGAGRHRKVLPGLVIAAGAIALVFSRPVAAVAADVFTPDHVAKIQAVRAAEISPDGRHVAYVLSVPRRPYKDENGPAWAELHVVDAEGTSRPYVTGEVNVSSMKWTPDERGISFEARQEHQRKLDQFAHRKKKRKK